MRRWLHSVVIALSGLLAWADAGALRLSELDRPDLADLGKGLPELRRSKRIAVRMLGDAEKTSEVLVKFVDQEQVLALTVSVDDMTQAVEQIQARNDVAFAEPNRRSRRQYIPSDPLLGNQWHHSKIGSEAAWRWGTGSERVKLAIVDAPFNLNHPDLAANSMNGWDVLNDVPVYSGNDDHASFSAGMAAAVLGNETGIAGAGNCTLIPINNAYADFTTDIALMDAAIRWAADHGVRVVNLSWEGAGSPTLNLAAEYLRATTDGIVVMAGVNGSGYLNYTNQPYIVAVSMTDSSDALQSRYGPHIDFCAPGYSVYSTTGSGYNTGSGTSYAAPLVSGILAVLFSYSPALTAEEALSILEVSAVDLGAAGWDQFFGSGRVDFGQAAWLGAAVAGGVSNLGDQQIEAPGSDFKISVEFHPGVAYSLMGATSLNQTVWAEVPAGIQTNGSSVEFMVGADAGSAFYRIIGNLDL